MAKTIEAYLADSPATLSTGEALAAALVLNRFDWLTKMRFTIADALHRVGPEWARLIPEISEAIKPTLASLRDGARDVSDLQALANVTEASQPTNGTTELEAKFVTHASAPGYRDLALTLDVSQVGSKQSHRFALRLSAEDSAQIATVICDVHDFAWRRELPLDATPGEKRPRSRERLL
jgi:hypothetical protein